MSEREREVQRMIERCSEVERGGARDGVVEQERGRKRVN